MMKTVMRDTYFFEVDVQYLQDLYNLPNDLPFLP